MKPELIDESLFRYRVERAKGGFWPSIVVGSNDPRALFTGNEKQAQQVSRELNTAFLEGNRALAATEGDQLTITSQAAEIAALRAALFTVCEGWTLPHDARKVLESALYPAPQADDTAESAKQEPRP